MALFSKEPLDRATLKDGTVEKVLSHFKGKEVAREDFELLRTALSEPAIRERLRTSEVVQAFAKLLVEGDEVARQQSAIILGLLGSPDAIPPLLKTLETDENSWIRAEAAKSLGQLGTEAVVAPLVEACTVGDFAVSFGAAEALARMGDPQGVQAIADRIASFADEGILAGRGAVGHTQFYIWPQYQKALENLSSPSAAEMLIPLLGKLYADERYRRECALGLIALILNTGEETAEKMAAVVPQDVLNDSLEHHRWVLASRERMRAQGLYP